MKQLFQQLNNGETLIIDVPTPTRPLAGLLVHAKYSLISAGTERTILDFGKSNWIKKIKKNPEKVNDVIAKIRSNGLIETYKAIKNKLDQPIPLGYSMVAEVLESDGVSDFKKGDYVVTNSPHSEISIPNPNICVKVPNNVSYKSAVFTPIASIGMQGINLLNLEEGATILLVGLGLIGQITGRILIAKGYKVLGVDLSDEKCKLANKYGISIIKNNLNFISEALSWTNGIGFDGVIITASSASSEIVNNSAECVKKRGKIVSVGVVGLNLFRPTFFNKECSIQVSCSYGNRSEIGAGSAKDNFVQILNLMSNGKLNLEDLISFEYDFEDSSNAYLKLFQENVFGILLKYKNISKDNSFEILKNSINLMKYENANKPHIGIIGAGNFTSRTLLPLIKKINYKVHTISSQQGYNAFFLSKKFEISYACSSQSEIINSKIIDTIFITTRHNTHFQFVKEALLKNKYVWVEKPLCISLNELNELRELFGTTTKLMIGFNRRFSPISVKLKNKLKKITEPFVINMVINAGKLPSDHWIIDPKIGGGRIIGEVCHFIDLAFFFVEKKVKSIKCNYHDNDGQDGCSFSLLFENDIKVNIDYRTDLPKHIPKEFIEINGGNWSISINNWMYLISVGLNGFKYGNRITSGIQKGHKEALQSFLMSVEKTTNCSISIDEIFEITQLSIIMQSMKTGESFNFL